MRLSVPDISCRRVPATPPLRKRGVAGIDRHGKGSSICFVPRMRIAIRTCAVSLNYTIVKEGVIALLHHADIMLDRVN